MSDGVKVISLQLVGIDPEQPPGESRTSYSNTFGSTSAIKQAVEEYIRALESDFGAKWCRCEWQTHPTNPKLKRMANPSSTCPIHSREGLILFFFEWALGAGQDTDGRPS